MAKDHPATVDMFEQPLIGVLVALCFVLLMNLYPLMTVLGWQALVMQMFCLRRRNYRGREKILCPRALHIQASNSSSIYLICKISCTSSLSVLFQLQLKDQLVI
jgi:hypothetical protein